MMSLLLGSDYDAGIRGIGIVNAIEVVNAFAMKKGHADEIHGDNEEEMIYDRLNYFRKWLDCADDETCEADKRFDEDKIQMFSLNHRSARKAWGVDKNFPNKKVLELFFRPQVN